MKHPHISNQQLFPGKISWDKISTILIGLCILLLLSTCMQAQVTSPNSTTTDEDTASVAGKKRMPCFILDADYLDTLKKTKRHAGGRKIILEISIEGGKGLESMQVYSYWAKNQKRHGDSADIKIVPVKTLLKDTASSPIDKGHTYIIANNYLTYRFIKEFLDGLIYSKGQEFSHLRLVPMKYPGQTQFLVFGIKAIDKKGQIIDEGGFVTGDKTTKPSPPAPPH